MDRRNLGALFALVVVLVAMAMPAMAAAAPSDDVYGGALGRVQSSQTDPGDKGLPFTGVDIGIILLAGTFLVGTGLALRRASRDN